MKIIKVKDFAPEIGALDHELSFKLVTKVVLADMNAEQVRVDFGGVLTISQSFANQFFKDLFSIGPPIEWKKKLEITAITNTIESAVDNGNFTIDYEFNGSKELLTLISEEFANKGYPEGSISVIKDGLGSRIRIKLIEV